MSDMDEDDNEAINMAIESDVALPPTQPRTTLPQSFSTLSMTSELDHKHGGSSSNDDVPPPPRASKRLAVYLQKHIEEDWKQLDKLRTATDVEAKALQQTEFMWPPNARIEAKIQFVRKVDPFTNETAVDLIAIYVLTWLQLNGPQHTAQMVELLFRTDDHANSRSVDDLTRRNLALCAWLETKQLQGTPLGDFSQSDYDNMIFRLQYLHEQNIRWYKHMLLAKEERATGRPISRLYEPPEVDDNARPNGSRDEIKLELAEQLLEFLFQKAGSTHLRHTEKSVFVPHITPDGHDTRCYQYESDLEPWIRKQITPKDLYPEMYHAFHKKNGTAGYLVEHLGKTPDPRFPSLQRSRTLFSFLNGIYNASNNKFYVYATDDTIKLPQNVHIVHELNGAYSTANYFPVAIPLEWFADNFNYKNIKAEVKNTESIFVSQDYDDNDLDWVEALSGRLQHDVGELDDWQNCLYIEGPAKTGKSLYLHLLLLWYMAMDVGLIGDDVEKFPDQHLVGKFIVACMDISHEFGLSPTRFFSWCSGDFVMVARKYLEAIAVKWGAPFVASSNNKPPIIGSGGAQFRRFVILQMLNAIITSDGKLYEKAKEEVAYYLIKCSLSYHDKVKKYGNGGLWDNKTILPKRFWQAREDFTLTSSWPEAFLKSGIFEFGEGFFIYEEDFKKQFDFFRDKMRHMDNVNSKKKTQDVKCNPINFANALGDMEIRCNWNKTLKKIENLRLKENYAQILAAQEGASRAITSSSSMRANGSSSSSSHGSTRSLPSSPPS